MNITLPDPSQFNIKDCIVAGDECILVTPKDMGVEWTDYNKVFRSSVWRKSDMYPISLSYKKFTNYGEKPDFEPWTEDCLPFEAKVKVDGSTLIVSRYKGELIIRTRGTIDASLLPNGHEIAVLKEKYPNVFSNRHLNKENITFLYEWTTPTNRIVLRESDEPKLTLIGAVNHNDYSYVKQYPLNNLALELRVIRPATIDLYDMDELKAYVDVQTDIEGVVIYSKCGQILKKLKTIDYLRKHRIYTGIKNVNHVIDLWIEHGCLSRDEFEAALSAAYDHELVVSIEILLNDMYGRWESIQTKLEDIKHTLTRNLHISRKEIAQLVLHEYKIWSSIAFEILDSKTHNIKKLFELNKRDE